MAERVLPARVAQIPNALTVARFAAIPVFIALEYPAEGGQELGGGDRVRRGGAHGPARRLARRAAGTSNPASAPLPIRSPTA